MLSTGLICEVIMEHFIAKVSDDNTRIILQGNHCNALHNNCLMLGCTDITTTGDNRIWLNNKLVNFDTLSEDAKEIINAIQPQVNRERAYTDLESRIHYLESEGVMINFFKVLKESNQPVCVNTTARVVGPDCIQLHILHNDTEEQILAKVEKCEQDLKTLRDFQRPTSIFTKLKQKFSGSK